jgi:hypothetical protein
MKITIPKRQYIVYFDEKSPMSNYNCAIIEVDSKDSKTGRIMEFCGGKKESHAKHIGEEIEFSRKHVGYLSGKHLDCFIEAVGSLEIKTKYLEFENPYMKERNSQLEKMWFVYQCFGYYLVMDALEKFEGTVIDDAFVEALAEKCEQKYTLSRRDTYDVLLVGDAESNTKFTSLPLSFLKTLTSLEALKLAGLDNMEHAGEKTMAMIKKSRLTMKEFKRFDDGEVFAKGECVDGPDGANMTGSGKKLRWLAKKGHGNDWCVYLHWETSSWDFIESIRETSGTS